MIFINATNGRTGNQLVTLAHLFASSVEYNMPFFNFGQTPDKDFIIQKREHQRSRHLPLVVKIVAWLATRPFASKLQRFLNLQIIMNFRARPNELVPIVKQAAKEHRNLLPYVWPYTDYAALYKHQEECRAFITPKEQYKQQADQIISKLRKTNKTLVGVHVRRTDYKDWFRGKYYFSPAVYEKALKEISELHPNGVHFIICSDEKLTAADFPSLPEEQLYFSRNSFIIDFVLLSSCDYIIGPPSTFSGYASFYGKAKKYTLFSSNQTISSTDQFGVIMIDYDDITEEISIDGDTHREYIKLSKGYVVSRCVPTLPA